MTQSTEQNLDSLARNFRTAVINPKSKWKYVIGISGVVVGTLLQLLLWHWVMPNRFIIYYPVIILTSWFGGWHSGIVATLLSAIFVNIFFMEPYSILHFKSPDLVQLIIFVSIDFLITFLNSVFISREKFLNQLALSERHFRLLYETMIQGVVYQDAEGNIISMNPAAEKILGKTKEEFLDETSVTVEHHTIKEDGSPFPGNEHPSMVALKEGIARHGMKKLRVM